ncbi:MAG: BamA/TamA family outer membrane protein [Sandaracinaceae bacterium]|nr:BamA/TamA family outer membrane protein [Sandaracinaceae bacterium]
MAQGWYDLPPGIEGYTAYQQRLRVVIDSREDRPAPGHGVRIEGFVDQGFDLEEPIDRRWIRYGGALGGFLDVGNNRVLGLWGLVRLADPLGSEPVPFVEQIALGGEPLLMAGFLRGALRGRSAAVATLEYRYPIWVFLDGSLHFSVGNVFDEHFEDFDVERLRMSFGLGFRSIADRDQSFNVLVAFGSEPFVTGANIDSVRIVVGSQQGF